MIAATMAAECCENSEDSECNPSSLLTQWAQHDSCLYSVCDVFYLIEIDIISSIQVGSKHLEREGEKDKVPKSMVCIERKKRREEKRREKKRKESKKREEKRREKTRKEEKRREKKRKEES